MKTKLINKEKLAEHICEPEFQDNFCNKYNKSKRLLCPHLNRSWEECDLFNQFLYRGKYEGYSRFVRCEECRESFEEVKK